VLTGFRIPQLLVHPLSLLGQASGGVALFACGIVLATGKIKAKGRNRDLKAPQAGQSSHYKQLASQEYCADNRPHQGLINPAAGGNGGEVQGVAAVTHFGVTLCVAHSVDGKHSGA
jgi:hypothetical protein